MKAGVEMAVLDYEAEYNNSARVSNASEITARWKQASAVVRAKLPAELDVAYGSGPRHRYDLFHAPGAPTSAPLAVYIHGGYWQKGDGRDYAFVASELVRQGVSVAIPSYRLCPEASVAEIIDDMRRFARHLWRKTKHRPVMVGHSAGAHLAACLMAGGITPSDDVPGGLVRSAVGLSGIYDAAPLIGTSINQAVGFDAAAARAVSPIFWSAPANGCEFVAAAGQNESNEFRRQAHDLVPVWSARGARVEAQIIEGVNHFTIVEELARPGSTLLARVVAMAQAA